MQIVIEIPEGLKDVFENRNVTALDVEEMKMALRNGTVLPKHGRLIDADAFEKDNSELWGCDFIHPKYCDTLADIVSDAPTILEADNETKAQ